MADFFKVSTRSPKKDVVEIYPKFIVGKSSDLMIRGGDFHAIWLEEKGLWSTDEQDVINTIDKALDEFYEERKDSLGGSSVKVLHMWDSGSGVIDSWHKYCQKQMRDAYHPLDDKLMFANVSAKKKDYASKRLAYPLEKGECPAYESLMSTLYAPTERMKIEWAIGAIVHGDSKNIQKFMVLYGAAGTGKSTVMHIIEQLFDGYYATFEAKVLGSANNAFALESFKSNPLVAINHDGDLSRIEDNTRLNSLVSHEEMSVNEKFKSVYTNRFRSFLFIGSNKPVKITDGKSGLLRRLIDVTPSGNKLAVSEYRRAMAQIPFELGAIAYHCREVYTQNPHRYDDYIPIAMLGASNDFYNYVLDSYHIFAKDDGTTLKAAWEMYKTYCEEAKVNYPASQRVFKEELRNYFQDYNDRVNMNDGSRLRSYYSGFRKEKFEAPVQEDVEPTPIKLQLDETKSILDEVCAEFPAQYASATDKPTQKWEFVRTTLSSLDTTRTHFLMLPENSGHIFIDFDLKDASGKKSLERNLIEAAKWPPTYAEVSKGGAGLHLHYLYDGDTSKLSSVYSDGIEIKVPKGNSSLRRRLSKCNALPIATINSGLPLKGDKKMVNADQVRSENGLRTLIKRNLCKEFHPGTKPSMDFIKKILDDAYKSDLKYDVSDMKSAILAFAASSSNQADYCIKLIDQLQFKSKDTMDAVSNEEQPIVFFDVEVFPNLFLVNWKMAGEGHSIVRMINPTPQQIEDLLRYRLIGFNCRRYDNHILYACLIGYTNQQLYELSQKIVTGSPNPFFGEAYNLSYTDIYCFSSKKQSLKKFEIELGLHHKELGLPWDEPVPEERWIEVAEYCDNDVIATEATFEARQSDFLARQILADLAGMSVNDTTNSLTTRIIFGKNRTPQAAFNYRNMGEITEDAARFVITENMDMYSMYGDDYTVFNSKGQPIFPGYKYEFGKSTYRGEEVGEGGYVYAEPGIYTNIALLDIASMHPHSVIAEELFGKEYTARFKEIVDARVAIKHKDFNKACTMLDGKLAKYLQDENIVGDLATALKIAINSVYGLTMAGFENPFRDQRNKDNIVAKRGALFMVNLKHFVQSKGFTVAHIKTDSIKIPNATPEIIQAVTEYGHQYGYTFEHEATYERMCLVNDAVYIAKYKDGKKAGKWTATGTQFAVPYVFKSLFSREEIKFEDMCETKSVTGTIFLDLNETLPEGEHDYKFVGKVGQFCPMRHGIGGGVLYREKDGKYYAVGGTKGYRWLESESVRVLGLESQIDRTYYEKMVQKAAETIAKYGDVKWFVSDNNVDDLPPWFAPGEPFGEDGSLFDKR